MVSDTVRRIEIRQQINNCQSCGCRSNAIRPVAWSGPAPNWVTVLGETPDAEEDGNGQSFSGEAGQLLRETVDKVGGEGLAETFSYVNTVCCWPGRTPSGEEIRACEPNRQSQIEFITPRYVLVLGGVPVSAYWPKLRVGDIRGLWWNEPRTSLHSTGSSADSQQPSQDLARAWFFATWHPTAVIRQGGIGSKLGREFLADIVKFVGVISRPTRPPPQNVQCVKCPDHAVDYNRGIGACQKHLSSLQNGSDVPGSVSTARTKRPNSSTGKEGSSARGRPKRSESSTVQGMFDQLG